MPHSLFTADALGAYLQRVHGRPVRAVRVTPLGGGRQGDKGYGYGIPLRVDYVLDGAPRRAVVESVRPGPFGHEHMADRAQLLLWAHHAFGRLPRHVASLDVGAVRASGELVPLGTVLGHGECIFGVVDSYPEGGLVSPQVLQQIESRCLAWRWKLKRRVDRLRQVHGDFHPWNILFREGADFSALDRSRGEWGEPADDVTCLALNYLFFSLQRCGRLEGDFERLWRRFWERYLERSGDAGLLEVAAPFFAWRALVMANPVWYPALEAGVRHKILQFALNVLAADRFDPARANEYCA